MKTLLVCKGAESDLAKSRPYVWGWLVPGLALGCICKLRESLPAWVVMWTLGFVLFYTLKWMTWRRLSVRATPETASRIAGYFFAWPGLNAAEFISNRTIPIPPNAREWSEAVLKTAAGASLCWGAARMVPDGWPVVKGAVGMAGMLLLLHCGLFHLLSLMWRRAGVRAQPIMFRPFFAESVTDFWGNRWNRAYRDVSHDFVFRPCAGILGPAGATLAAFLVSGIVHDLVISVPARGGYGLPTLYFLIQAAALFLERSALGRRCLGNSRVRHWLYCFACIAGPVGLLFHPRFLTNVIVPFMRAVGAL